MKTRLSFLFLLITIFSLAQNIKEVDSLSRSYYYDFISPTLKLNHDFMDLTGDIENDSLVKLEIEKLNQGFEKKSQFSNSAELALENFLKLWEISPEKREVIYYPIKQLGCYLKKDLNYIKLPKTNLYFPINQFTYFKKNWECDYSINYLFEIELSKLKIEHLKIQLENLNEPDLYNMKVEDATIYRFTWLRIFHKPIAIRIENIGEDYFLYWKVGKGAGGYTPKGLLKDGRKKITIKEWKIFENLLRNENFVNLRNYQSMIIGDGATWTMEEKTIDSFRAKQTKEPDTNFYRSCMYLIKLTGLVIPEEETY